ncbi:MAG: DUF1987 domain-containing protein [Bacteroidia bacterium]|nr:DUF1987 domain-containing protein [Bacteroidia bacterium]
MKSLYIPPTDDTPLVQFIPETNDFRIEGNSYPENSAQFYQPVVQWLTENLGLMTNRTTFHFNFDYFNTSSAKFILELLRIIEDFHNRGNEALIKWYYLEDDIDVLESGEDYQRIIKVPFELVERQDV